MMIIVCGFSLDLKIDTQININTKVDAKEIFIVAQLKAWV